MLEIKKKEEESLYSPHRCYYCGVEIIDQEQKYCPNCDMILYPNHYIDWKRSFIPFLSILCLLPLLIAVLIKFS